ncbi:MAG TPA: 3'-5' exonuclease [Candidatus Thermoplasmatota archaeon]
MTPAYAGGLVERALDRLRGGPAHTFDLARDVLGLSGPSGAVSAAVFTLLGADARFRVDEHGVWSLGEPPSGPPLPEVAFGVVDVETTGGSFLTGHRIIEIAVVQVRGGQVGETWRTLVNPGRFVPGGVQALTGITDEMVSGAPYFDHVADEVADRLEGRVFVAHNAAFDWRFVCAELGESLGVVPASTCLCTVRMARRLLPGLRRRNLDALSHHYGIPNHARHRAGGDALATARVLVRLLEEASLRGIGDLGALQAFLGNLARRRRRRRTPRAQPGNSSLAGPELRAERGT